MLGNALGVTGTGNTDDQGEQGSSTGGPAIRTFRIGTPGGGGMVAGGSISFGGPSRLARGRDGRFPLMGSPGAQRPGSERDGRPDDQDGHRHGPVGQDVNEFGDMLADLLGGSMRRVGGRADGPAIFTNARPSGITPDRAETLEDMMYTQGQ
jgi:hypothetical protein